MENNTRVLSDQFFNYFLDIEVERAKRYQNYVSLVHIRFDENSEPIWDDEEFESKAVNILSSILDNELREVDIIGRTEKNTFSVILLHADEDATFQVCERLRSKVQEICSVTSSLPTTVSIGSACCPVDGCETYNLKKLAYGMLERAAQKGGNRTMMTSRH